MNFGANTFIWESPFGTCQTVLFGRVKVLGLDAIEAAVENPALIDPHVVLAELQRCGVPCLWRPRIFPSISRALVRMQALSARLRWHPTTFSLSNTICV